MLLNLIIYLYDDIKDDVLGRACVSHGAVAKFINCYCSGNL